MSFKITLALWWNNSSYTPALLFVSEPSCLCLFTQNSMFGRCEVLYEMKRIPRAVAFSRPQLFPSAQNCRFLNFLEIFKTRNFTNCEYSAEFHFGLPASKKCHPGGNECGDFWNVSTKQRQAMYVSRDNQARWRKRCCCCCCEKNKNKSIACVLAALCV